MMVNRVWRALSLSQARQNSPTPSDVADAISDALIFTRIIDHALTLPVPLTVALGLSPDEVMAMAARHASDRIATVRRALAAATDGAMDGGGADDAIEEGDLIALILDHGGHDGPETRWLAAILARRSLATNHLWQDMGFANRDELTWVFSRHFPSLKALNDQDMKWKKFFYRQLCEREGFSLCKAPNCEICDDFEACFSGEPGESLAALSRPPTDGARSEE